jgi:predicted PilT family ATPase
MLDPVFAADGFIYEREVIEEHMERDDFSPVTRKQFEHRDLTPATIIKLVLRSMYAQKPVNATYYMIPKRYIGFVIGKSGKTLRKVEEYSSCSLSVNQTKSECMVKVVGGNAQRAVEYLRALVTSAQRLDQQNLYRASAYDMKKL